MNTSYIFVKGLRIHYRHWNLDGGGQPVVLLHGLAQNSRYWERTAEYLAQRGLVVFAPDARGHGFTDDPPDGYSLEAAAGDIGAYCAALNIERPVLVGHSWGAQAALWAAAGQPVGLRAPAGIVLVDGGVQEWHDRLDWKTMQVYFGPQPLNGLTAEKYARQLTAQTQKWQPDEAARAAMLSRFEVGQDDVLHWRVSLEAQSQVLHSLWEAPTHTRFSQVRCPVQIIAARFPEPYSPPEAEAMAAKETGIAQAQAQMTDVRVHWMPDTIHSIHLQRPVLLGERIAEFVAAVK